MFIRHKFVTNSSSSSYTLLDALRKLREAERLLMNARGFIPDSDDGRYLIPDLEEVTADIRTQLTRYIDEQPTHIDEIMARVRKDMANKFK